MNPSQAPSTFHRKHYTLPRADGVPHPPLPRLTLPQVISIIKAASGLSEKKLTVTRKTPPQGHAGERWMEVEADSYLLAFWVHDNVSGGSIYECFYARSPKGSEWFAPDDGGRPFEKFSANETAAISKALYVGWLEDDCEVLVAQLWRVALRVKSGGLSFVGGAMDHGSIGDTPFPKELLGHSSFATKQEAEEVAARYKIYRKNHLAEKRRLADQSTEKSNKNSK